MATLSENDAEYIVKDMLSIIRKGIKDNGSAIVAIAQLERIFDPIKREGNTPDVYCKIAWAAFEHRIATDVVATRDYGMAMKFKPAEPYYKKPSPEICDKRWRDANELGKFIEFTNSDLIEYL